MDNLLRLHGELENSTPENIVTLEALKEYQADLTNQIEEINVVADEVETDLHGQIGELDKSTGFREKRLGGLFGGNKEAASDLKEAKANLERVEEISEGIDDTETFLGDAVFEQAVEIICEDDGDFASIVEHRNMMDDALNLTEAVLVEINEALEALANAEDAEEWDMLTDGGFAEIDSDIANSEAADEVDDVTNILQEYRTFLHDMGESAAGLEGSDFDFSWGDMLTEDFFGDFWGSSAMLDKINDAQDNMANLHDKISQLYDSFEADYDAVVEQVNERVDAEWEAM